jgi:putative membrane protein insertion efficiency factor
MKRIVLGFIRMYQLAISSVTVAHCRFYPSCSQYAVDAIQSHGLIRGTYLALKRLSHCHPWHAGGYDPVPEKEVA